MFFYNQQEIFNLLLAEEMQLKNVFREAIVSFKIGLMNLAPGLVGQFYRLFWKPKNEIEKRISEISRKSENFTFLQIGANDGIINDPILKFILRDNWTGIRVEPLPAPFQKLQQLHAANKRVQTIQTLIANEPGKMSLYHYSFSNKRWATGLASLEKAQLEKHIESGHVESKAKKFGDKLPSDKSTWITETELPVEEINQFIAKAFSYKLNLLQIDTEGFDHVLVNALNLEKIDVDMICFERLHILENQFEPCLSKLKNYGYQIVSSNMDLLAFKD